MKTKIFVFLHQNFCFFSPKFLFFYTKIIVFLHQIFFVFLHQIKIFCLSKMQIFGEKLWLPVFFIFVSDLDRFGYGGMSLKTGYSMILMQRYVVPNASKITVPVFIAIGECDKTV